MADPRCIDLSDVTKCGSLSLVRLSQAVLLCLCWARLSAVTFEEMLQDEKLTPKKFASYFGDFRYLFKAEVQEPNVFLTTQAGDCDDYAVLADRVLRPKGYDTRLISVRMPGMVTHVVCYVKQEKGYLDYNNRVYMIKIERCGPTIREIAGRVAKSQTANWTTASEFTFKNGLKYMVATVVKTDSPDRDPKPGESTARMSIDF